MKFKAVIFDLDGTLLNSLVDIADSVNLILNRWNLPVHDIESYKYFVGNGIKVLSQKALPANFDHANFPEFLKDVEAEYSQRQFDKTRPYEGIIEMLTSLMNKNISISILSNKPDEFTQVVVKHYFPSIEFDCVLGARDGIPRKPDPHAVYEIIDKIGLSSSDFTFVGDTSTDILTGKNADLFTMGVSWGFRTVKELEESGADVIIHQPTELLSFILN